MDTLSVEATAGDYTLENVQAWTLPRAAIRREAIVVPQNSALGTDGKMVFCGELAMPEDGWLITSYPYRDGYTVLVDGKAREMKKVNTAFIGLPLEAGSHEIEIRYTAPGFRAGLWISLLSGVAAICWAIWCMRRKRGKNG